jgi:phosphoglycolate phosphatase
VSAVAFDLDGCLIESRTAIVPSMRVALESLGLPEVSNADLYALIGPPLESGVAALLTRLGEDPARALDLVTAYRADYREHMLDRTTLMPGVDHAVRAVHAVRPVCVVTSKPAELSAKIVDHFGLGSVFRFVEGPSLAMEQETKTETLRRALERLDIGVMVGDRHHDIDAGRAHGLTTVGVLWGMGDADELSSADHVVRTADELVELLAQPERLREREA